MSKRSEKHEQGHGHQERRKEETGEVQKGKEGGKEVQEGNLRFLKTGKKQRVTLIEMDLGKLFQDEASFKKLTAMGQVDDMAAAREKLKDIPGLRFEPAERVEIEFK